MPLRIALLFVCAFVTACAGDSGRTTIATKFDPCDPPRIVADGSATAAETEGVADALALWEADGFPQLAAPSGAQTLPVRFQKAAPQFHGFYDDLQGVIYVNDDLTTPSTLAIVIAHELGHAFGLQHVSASTRPSVMNPGNLTVKPNAEDRSAVESLWGVCTSGS